MCAGASAVDSWNIAFAYFYVNSSYLISADMLSYKYTLAVKTYICVNRIFIWGYNNGARNYQTQGKRFLQMENRI